MALNLSLSISDLKLYLRVENDLEDGLITQMQREAASEAEGFLNTDFGGQEAPPEVAGWIKNRVALKYENRGNVPEPKFGTIRHLRVLPFSGIVIETKDDGIW